MQIVGSLREVLLDRADFLGGGGEGGRGVRFREGCENWRREGGGGWL
jgi:hypothetical protein